jgi:DNA-binding MarR family transcriptional regulator
MATDIGRIYTDAQVTGFKENWALELITLHERGPMTITELADALERTHSGVSQKVAAMRDAGFVETRPGPDARSKLVTLTEKTRQMMGLLTAEWQATEAAIAELEAEIPYPLSLAVSDLEHALRRESFYDRIRRRLGPDADGTAHAIG